LLLIMGIVSKSEIISWADDLIARPDNVPEWLLDVSLAANGDDMAVEAKLRDLPYAADCTTAAYSAIDRFAEAFHSGSIPPQAAARMLERWAASVKVNQHDWSEAMEPSWIAREIEYGYTSEQDVIASVNKCLTHFASLRR
jgi:hypothetical protein